MKEKVKKLEVRVVELEKKEERRQRNLQELVQQQIENEKKRQMLKSNFN